MNRSSGGDERHPVNAFTSSEAVDPQLRRLARLLPHSFGLHRGFTVQRRLFSLVSRVAALGDVSVEWVSADVSVRVHRPEGLSDRAPALLWIHGGGTITGAASQDDKYCRRLAHMAGVAVVSVDHRLAPEHPYPVPVEDCCSALMWLARQPWTDPTRLAVGGASAGGNFAAAVSQRARDRGDITLAAQMLVYPQLDDRTGAGGAGRPRIIWNGNDNQLAWNWYLSGADPREAAPARCEDLRGLPPAWIGVGTLDLFYDECAEYARRLRDAGVTVHTDFVPGAFHTFDQLAPNARVSSAFIAGQVHFLQRTLSTR